MADPSTHPDEYAPLSARFGEDLGVPWYVAVNDLVGGWSVSHVDKPLSQQDFRKGEGEIADFCSEAAAQHIVKLHNDWLSAAKTQATDPNACCKRHVPGPIFTTFEGDPTPEFVCPECGARWLWDDNEAEGGAWFYDPENDQPEVAHTREGDPR